jgi:hypothetical protein
MAGTDHGGWGGREIFSNDNWQNGTEYGGVGGLVAPIDSPHTPNITGKEELMLIHASDPGDPSGTLLRDLPLEQA